MKIEVKALDVHSVQLFINGKLIGIYTRNPDGTRKLAEDVWRYKQ